MHTLDWLVVGGYLAVVVVDGLRRSREGHGLEGLLLAGRRLPWWVVGLSVMATQLSAITLVGTTGQGATDGLRFIQFYLGLPLAMIILSVTLVPVLRAARVYTAYEYLERRFDARTRTLTSLLFLLSRGMAAGVVVSAPAVLLSGLFGWPLPWAVVVVGAPAIAYAAVGGVAAVAWADVKQMALIVAALMALAAALVVGLPDDVGLLGGLRVAGAAGRLDAFDFRPTLTETYTVWSGLLGGTFLMLSYFGTDQSQVQRHLTAASTNEARRSLLMSAYWKIPLQALVLLVGVLIFVHQVFERPPLLFNPSHEARVLASARASEYAGLQARFAEAHAARREAGALVAGGAPAAANELRAGEAAVGGVRAEALGLARAVTGESPGDANYVIGSYVLGSLPPGLPGLFVAAVLAAAMSTLAAELSALATTSVVDVYRRRLRRSATDAHYVSVARLLMVGWGAFACVVAVHAAGLGTLIEVVNRFGSFFYGSILGVFLLALTRGARAPGAFFGLLAGMAAVAAVSFLAPSVSFLWYNVVGAVSVFAVGMGVSAARPGSRP